MVTSQFSTSGLVDLCSQDQLELLDSIDALRSQGINHYVSLPQIIVCGDQSSGKSSVLEAISGVPFPVKGNTCTRFPTELILRKASNISVSVSIIPHESAEHAAKDKLASYHEKLDNFDSLPTVIEHAKSAMGIFSHGNAFSKDLLRIEITGPHHPHLTIVDLPGLIHSETKHQTAHDVQLIQDVVRSYMQEQRSIILAVISAKNDFANQIVLKLARQADPKGTRTLGVITKPDVLIPNSESEAMFISLAKNQDVEFRLGWHVLRNMDSDMGESTLSQRDIQEVEFFSKGTWNELPQSIRGISKLRGRLSKLLLSQIASELPNVVLEIESKRQACRSKLDKFGVPRGTVEEQRRYLLQISQSFQLLVKASVDGTYNDSFFGDSMSEVGYNKRIRAVVQSLGRNFATTMTANGHYRHIVTSKKNGVKIPDNCITITEADFIDHIQGLMERTAGRELPGTFSPMIVANLFADQCSPWDSIVRKHVDRVWKAAKTFIHHVIEHVADMATSKALLKKVIDPGLDHILQTLRLELTKIVAQHQSCHPITYNRDFIITLQEFRHDRLEKRYSAILSKFFGTEKLENVSLGYTVDLTQLRDKLLIDREPDVYRHAASEALDCLKAYYEVKTTRNCYWIQVPGG
jgi:hypothetical protein